MARQAKRGATRKPVRKEKKVIAWHYIAQQSVVLVAALCVIAAIIIVRQSNILPILHVKVEGEFNHIDKQQLVEAVKPFTRGSFLSIDVDKISEAGESLAWIRQVQVRRVWPDSLHLIVEEQIPVARWKQQAYVNRHGEVFPASKRAFPEKMAALQGPEQSQALLTKRYLEMTQQLKALDMTISALAMNDRRAWSMTLNTGLKVVLGRANSAQRFERFLRVYPQHLAHVQSQMYAVDMRYPNGLAVSWKSGQKPDLNGTV